MTAPGDLLPAERRRLLATVTARSLGTVVGLVLLYYVLPFDRLSSVGATLLLLLGLAGLVLLLVLDVRAIIRARYPGLRAVEAVATLIPLFLLLFSALYYLLARSQPGSFTEHLSRTDALYFTLTTFATVGYGDITAETEGARIAVMFQMVLDLIVIGVGIKALFGAVQVGRKRLAEGEGRDPVRSSGAPGDGPAPT